MADFKLYCLGRPVLEMNGDSVKLEMRKSLALLIYLRMADHDYSRESLSALFWPEYDQQHAQANLRRVLSSLNKSLQGELLEADREKIGLKDCSKVWLDVEKFQKINSTTKNHPHANDQSCPECLRLLDEANQLYRGDFLEGFNLSDCPAFDEWQLLQRENLRQELGLVLKKIVQAYASQSEWETASAYARRWVELDRLNEPACRTLMNLYARSGQRSAALRQYEDLTRSLNEQLGQQPEGETRQLFEQIQGREEAKKRFEVPERSSSFPLLKTKLYIPTVSKSRVIRSELTACLDEVERKVLSIISAPAGFGKTTLLAEWSAKTSLPVAWLSLDNGDNDPYRFLAYIIAALESIHEDVGFEARQIMQSTQIVPFQIILASLINDLGKVAEPYVLVLDDYQFIIEPAVHETMAYLLDHIPSNMHIVLATRADPPLQLGRLRAHNQLLELRTQDLRFNPEEAGEFLNTIMRLGLSIEDIDALEARTEGWIVGLKMAALSLQGRRDVSDFIRAFSGSHRYVLDYLMEEVLKQQTSHIQTFLLETSILEKMNGSLCDALMTEEWRKSGESGQVILEYLEKSNLFVIPLDENKQWYRYHHLFADLLQSRLNQFSTERGSALHLQASQWFEGQGSIGEAIDHALLSGDYHRTAILVDKSAQKSVLINVFTVKKWIEQIPKDIVLQHPWICVTQAWIWVIMGELEMIEELLQQAEDCIRKVDNPLRGTIENKDIQGHIAMLRAYVAFFRGNPAVTIEKATFALQNIRLSNYFLHSRIALQLGESYSIIGELEKGIQFLYMAVSSSLKDYDYSVATVAYFRLGTVLKILGKLAEADKIYQDNFQILRELGGHETSILGKPEIGMGDLLRERGQLDTAQELLIAGHQHSKAQGQPYDLIYSYIFLANLYQAQSRHQQALEVLSEAAPLFLTYTIPPVVRLAFENCQVKLWLRMGILNKAELWVAENQLDYRIEITYPKESSLISLSRVLIAQGRLIEAQELLNRLVVAAEASRRYGRLIEILIIQSLTLQALGEMMQALRVLTKALVLAEPEGYLRVFLDEGRSMTDLLTLGEKQGSWNTGPLKDYVDQLLNVFEGEIAFS